MELVIKIIEKEIERREILLAVEKNVLIQNDMSNEIGILRDSVKKLALCSVGCSLPSKDEVVLELKQIAHLDKLTGCPENQKQAYKNGFMHGIKFKRTNGKSDM